MGPLPESPTAELDGEPRDTVLPAAGEENRRERSQGEPRCPQEPSGEAPGMPGSASAAERNNSRPGIGSSSPRPHRHSRVRCCCCRVHAGRRFARFCPDPRGLHAEEQRGSLGLRSRVDVSALDVISNEPAASQRDSGFFRLRERWSSGAFTIPGTVFFRRSRLPQRSSAGSQRSRLAGLRSPTGVMRATVPLLQKELVWGLRARSDNAG